MRALINTVKASTKSFKEDNSLKTKIINRKQNGMDIFQIFQKLNLTNKTKD